MDGAEAQFSLIASKVSAGKAAVSSTGAEGSSAMRATASSSLTSGKEFGLMNTLSSPGLAARATVVGAEVLAIVAVGEGLAVDVVGTVVGLGVTLAATVGPLKIEDGLS